MPTVAEPCFVDVSRRLPRPAQRSIANPAAQHSGPARVRVRVRVMVRVRVRVRDRVRVRVRIGEASTTQLPSIVVLLW